MTTSLPFDDGTLTTEPHDQRDAVRLPDAQLINDAAVVGKACGLKLWQRDGEWCDTLGPWDPLECDDDALELAFVCGMTLDCQPPVDVQWRGKGLQANRGVLDDRTRGLRRAIVRMAAGAVQEMPR